jgi:single-strand DNA-binding protein
MYSLNRATLLGNLTRDPEVKQLTSGQTVCTFGMATNRSWTDQSGVRQEKAEFHNIVAWGKLGEILGQYLAKGKRVYVEGRLQTRDWEGQDGIKRYRTEIVAENAIILDKAGVTGGGFAASGQAVTSADDPSVDPSTEIKVEDIPF